ncbi:hypothetical protein [Pedobacter steynii]|nr:hypothetical protein [Pedobacter steynii]
MRRIVDFISAYFAENSLDNMENKNTGQTIGKVLRKAKFWESPQLLSINERQRLMLNKLLEGFEGKLTSSKWAKIAKCLQDTATRDIQNLVKRGLMLKEKGGGRSTSYVLNI